MALLSSSLLYFPDLIGCMCISLFAKSCISLFAIPWIVAHQAPLTTGLSRQEYWSRLPCSSPGDFPDPGIKPLSPVSPALYADSLLLSYLGSPYYSITLVKLWHFILQRKNFYFLVLVSVMYRHGSLSLLKTNLIAWCWEGIVLKIEVTCNFS